ncbi:hypothetical protein [Microbacterium sp. PMB16]|uniref:hypothetical protein n=1 Tax=Microbacterium sp. PMB16 TaxID=3120157 RepID=UPI003F4C2DFB
MPGESDAEELRALQLKAYGRDGGLTDAEARRLRELEDMRFERPATATAWSSSDDAATDPVGPDLAPVDSEPRTETPADEQRPDEVPHTPKGLRRQHGLVIAVASLLLVAIGAGAGWAIFRDRPEELVMTQEQQQRQSQLVADGSFDTDSVRVLAEEHGALAWYATKDDAATSCLILDVEDRSQQHCMASDDLESGLSVWMPMPRRANSAGEFESENMYATLLRTTAGEPIVRIERWESGSGSLLEGYEGEERTRAEALLADGYDLGLSIVGYFQDQPVWLGDRLADDSSAQKCLIVDAANAIQCVDFDDALTSGLETSTVDVDTATGAVTNVTEIDLRFTQWQTPLLTITNAVGFDGLVVPGESLVVSGPPGDPIRVTAPGQPEG